MMYQGSQICHDETPFSTICSFRRFAVFHGHSAANGETAKSFLTFRNLFYMQERIEIETGYYPERTPVQYVEGYLASIGRAATVEEKQKLIGYCMSRLIINPWELKKEAIREHFSENTKSNKCLCESKFRLSLKGLICRNERDHRPSHFHEHLVSCSKRRRDEFDLVFVVVLTLSVGTSRYQLQGYRESSSHY